MSRFALLAAVFVFIEGNALTAAGVPNKREKTTDMDKQEQQRAPETKNAPKTKQPEVELPPPRPPPEGIRILRDIEFGRGGERVLRLDLFLPEKASPKPLPVVVWVPGGGWIASSKEYCGAVDILDQGYIVASIEYRISSEALFPAQIHDCKAAIRWLRANASKYNMDPNRIGAWGGSAGGHLVALLGTSGDVKDLEGNGGNPDFSSRIQAAFALAGPTDFNQYLELGKDNWKMLVDVAEKLIGGKIEDNPEKVAQANPITYVNGDEPPFLLATGDSEKAVPYQQSVILHQALVKAGCDATLHMEKGKGHAWLAFQMMFGMPKITELATEFFGKHLKTETP